MNLKYRSFAFKESARHIQHQIAKWIFKKRVLTNREGNATIEQFSLGGAKPTFQFEGMRRWKTDVSFDQANVCHIEYACSHAIHV